MQLEQRLAAEGLQVTETRFEHQIEKREKAISWPYWVYSSLGLELHHFAEYFIPSITPLRN